MYYQFFYFLKSRCVQFFFLHIFLVVTLNRDNRGRIQINEFEWHSLHLPFNSDLQTVFGKYNVCFISSRLSPSVMSFSSYRWPFHDGGRYHTETSRKSLKSNQCHLLFHSQENRSIIPQACSANQWTGFYMISASVMKGLTVLCLSHVIMWHHLIMVTRR